MNDQMLLARRRILLSKQSGSVLSADMVLLINSPNIGDFSVTTNYGTFTAVKVSEYQYFDTTVTHKLSISDVTFSTWQRISGNSTIMGLFVGVESWGTSNTYTDTSNLFNGCHHLRGIPASWEGLGKLTNAISMFAGCTLLSSIPASWEGLGKLTNAVGMFSACITLTSIPASWEGLVGLYNAYRMFQGCASLSSIPDSWEGLEGLYEAASMFADCTSLTNCGTIFTGLGWVHNVSYLFAGCSGMKGDIHALYVYLSAVDAHSACFRNCTQAIGYESIPAGWK